MYFQLVESQVLSTRGQPDVNLHRLTAHVLHGAGIQDARAEDRAEDLRRDVRAGALRGDLLERGERDGHGGVDVPSADVPGAVREHQDVGVQAQNQVQVESTVCTLRLQGLKACRFQARVKLAPPYQDGEAEGERYGHHVGPRLQQCAIFILVFTKKQKNTIQYGTHFG